MLQSKKLLPIILVWYIYILFTVFLFWVKHLGFNAPSCLGPPLKTRSLYAPRPTVLVRLLLTSYWLQGLLTERRVISFLEERYLWLKRVLKTWEYWSWFWEMLALNHLIYLNIGFILSFLKDRLLTQKMNNLEGKKYLSSRLSSLHNNREKRGLRGSLKQGQTE